MHTPPPICQSAAVLAGLIKTPVIVAVRPCRFGRDVASSLNVKLGDIGEVGEPSVLVNLVNLG